MPHRFSPSEKAFYSVALEARYRAEKSWPNDLVDVTDAQYREYALSSPPVGKMLSADAAGTPTWIDVPPPEPEPAETRRARAIARIDRAADQARAADRSIGQYLDAEYRVVNDALAEWRARESDDAPVPPAIEAWADAEGISAIEAAEQIAEAAGRAEDLLLAVRHVRLAGKGAIRDAGDDADFDALVQTYIEQFEQIEASVPGA
ncbi:tail fiber assembly protein [Kushneria phosphatilytica]|uniref:Uncharacterized protein n=1 Tax=Kushneria phosphatilytica TaxID=657387 RepID=A0A1S1NW24_9GAMM|nr:tail fiber assembly protein [Kushneria phosphatilytica]OHV11197.1 hypothetical protein BH688_07690 [Kushneria phosphatilytica]QEL12230.1 hypothetical protein FY550_14530 [Kushneria phosphatilytica]